MMTSKCINGITYTLCRTTEGNSQGKLAVHWQRDKNYGLVLLPDVDDLIADEIVENTYEIFRVEDGRQIINEDVSYESATRTGHRQRKAFGIFVTFLDDCEAERRPEAHERYPE